MKINLKNRFSLWILLHSNLMAFIIGLLTLVITWLSQPWNNFMYKLISSSLYAYIVIIVIWFLINYLKDKNLYYLQENEAFYLWLKKNKKGAELGNYFWREKNTHYYKIFFDNLPSIKIMHLNHKAIILHIRHKKTVNYFTIWLTLICELKEPYKPNDLYEKIIKTTNDKEKLEQREWKNNNIYILRKYIVHKITQLLIKNPELLALLQNYKTNQDKIILTAVKQSISNLNPKNILGNCVDIKVIKIESKIFKNGMPLVGRKWLDNLKNKKE